MSEARVTSHRQTTTTTTTTRAVRAAFTLTELLIVIGIMTLVVTMAIPAFRAITGGRSIDAAENQLAALLGQTRAEAIGLQEERGLLFFLDPGTGRVAAAMVHSVAAEGATDVPLDLVPNREFAVLPTGVALQTMVNATVGAGSARTSDAYLGYNKAPAPAGGAVGTPGAVSGPLAAYATTTVDFGGVILFDGKGRLIVRQYSFVVARLNTNDNQAYYTQLGALLYGKDPSEPVVAPTLPATSPTEARVGPPANHPSQVAFVMFDQDAYNSRGFLNRDSSTTITTSPPASNYTSQPTATNTEQIEEWWIEGNQTQVESKLGKGAAVGNTAIFLINRFTGALLRNG